MVCSTQRQRHDCDQRGVKSALLEDQVGEWLTTLRIPDDWREDIDRLQRRLGRRQEDGPKIDRSAIEEQMRRLGELYLGLHITREEFVGRRRALEASLQGGLPQPKYDEGVLVEARRLLKRLGELWSRASAEQRAEIVGSLFDQVRVRDKRIDSVKLAREEYRPLVASATARQLTVVGLAPPERFELPTQALGRPRSIH